LSRFPNRVEHRHFAIEHLAAFARRHARDHIRAIFDTLARVKRAGAAGDSLHEQPRVLIDQNRHRKLGKQERRKKN